MFLFLLALFPLLCADFYYYKGNRRHFIVFFSGFLMAVAVCTYNGLFMYSSQPRSASYFPVFFRLLFTHDILPAFLPYAVFCLFYKSTADFKISSYFPLTAVFYAVYMPYKIIGSLTVFPFFVLFIKPCMYAQMIFVVSAVLGDFYSSAFLKKDVNASVISGVMLFLAALFPAVVETSWYIGMHFYVWIPELLLFAAYTAAVYFNKSILYSVCMDRLVLLEKKFQKKA